MTLPENDPTRGRKVRIALYLLAGIALVVGAEALGLFDFGTVKEAVAGAVNRLFAFLKAMGPWGPVLFILLNAAAVFLLFPGPVFSLGGGFLFGLWGGFLCGMAGSFLGALIAFLIGRYLFSGRIASFFRNHPRFSILNRGIRDSGWRFVFATRVTPMFPFKISNYFFGVIGFPLPGFLLGNALGLIPYQLLGAYTGSLIQDLSELSRGGVGKSPLQWALSGGGLLLGIVFFTHFAKKARRDLAQHLPEAETPTASSP